MKNFILTATTSLLMTTSTYGACIHELNTTQEVLQQKSNYHLLKDAFVHEGNGIYKKLSSKHISKHMKRGTKNFSLQLPLVTTSPEGYNDKYLEYYRYQRLLDYLTVSKSQFEKKGYEYHSIGKSLKNRDLFVLKPKDIDPNKKTILMFGRHHGDEGTANWIIEGFLNRVFNDHSFLENYQLVLYPMVNPDGAEAMSRYNSKGRDLNRAWGKNSQESYDEIITIHSHIEKVILEQGIKPIIALDMHGSYTEDFIYRVSKSFKSTNFYNTQQEFISELGAHDIWQKGNFEVSNGHKKMARIMMVRDHSINALTHETPRNISKRSDRTLADLKEQGHDIVKAITALY